MRAIIPIGVNDSTTGWVQKKSSRHALLWNHPPSCRPIV